MDSVTEPHFSVQQVGEMWQLSPDKVRLLFRNEPGVIKVGVPERLHKRSYFYLRIPQSVLARVYNRMKVAV